MLLCKKIRGHNFRAGTLNLLSAVMFQNTERKYGHEKDHYGFNSGNDVVFQSCLCRLWA